MIDQSGVLVSEESHAQEGETNGALLSSFGLGPTRLWGKR
jgi:hypothetical protein